MARETAISRSNCGVSSSRVAPVRLGADPARVDRRDEVRPALAGLAEGDDRAGRDGLGAVHVGVDDVRPDLGQVGGQGPDRDGVVRVVDDEDRDAGALELAHRAAGRQRHDRHVVAGGIHPGHEREEVLLGAAVGAGREDLDDADPPPAGEVGTLERRQAADPTAAGALMSAVPSSDEQPLDRLVDRAPLVLVGLVAAQEVEPPDAGRQGTLDQRVDHEHAGRQVARVGVDAGVVVEVAVAGLEVDPGRDPPAADRQERQAQRPVRRRGARTGAGRGRGSARRRACRGTGRRRPISSGGAR